MSDLVDICMSNSCQYDLEFCIGSGRSVVEQCIWLPTKSVSGTYSESQMYLVHQSFEVDDVRSSFYFNSNLTFRNDKKASKMLRFKDELIKYDASSGTYSTLKYSTDFTSITIDIDVSCKSGFYPPFWCTRSCFGVPGMSRCDINGTTICLKGYILLPSTGECIKDKCKFGVNICKNNSTCTNEKNGVTCQCQPNYTGIICDDWDPCRGNNCKNSGLCVKRKMENDYICQCIENFKGKFCEIIIDPCREKLCPPQSMCQKHGNDTRCVLVTRSPQSGVNIIDLVQNIDPKRTTLLSVAKKEMKIILEDSESKNRETVKLIQYPLQKDFTTISIIIVLLVFLVCCFGVTFWMQRYKYFQKRKKYSSYPNIPPMPSVIQMPTYRSADDNFKRWHSLDDSSFYLCHQPVNEQFSTMSYKSGSNLWPRYDSTQDNYRNSYRHWGQTLKTRMPMMNESSNFESSERSGDLNESTHNTLEKMEDFISDPQEIDSVNMTVPMEQFI